MTRDALVLGATIDGYAVEGGYDVEGGPATTYCAAQSLGHVRPSLRSGGTYAHLADLVRCAAGVGVRELRLTLEWARLERRPGERDDEAMASYVRALRAAADASMTTVVVLCDTALPSWTGAEPWLSAWAPPRFAAHAAWVAERVDGLARAVVTMRAPNVASEEGWRSGVRPPFRRRADRDADAALDGMLLAHQLATEAIASVAPSVARALLLGASAAYDESWLVCDLAAGVSDDVLQAARRERWARHLAAGARLRSPGRARVRHLERSTPRWNDLPAFETWLASADADLLAASLAFSDGAIRTVELGAGAHGWEAQLAAGVPALTSGPCGATTVHLHGLVASTGPLAAPIGLLDVDQHDGAWTACDTGGRVARRLAALS